MLCLDVCCGGGGAARGLQQAGFHVTGVDIVAQPRYAGDVFIKADALEYLARTDLSHIDMILASPPCQRYTSLRHAPGKHRTADLIPPTRELLKRSGHQSWVIENVEGAPLIDPVTLCGSMFSLEAGGFHLQRHRLFEASFPLKAPGPCTHKKPVVSVIGGHFRDRRRPTGANHRSGSNVPSAIGRAAMGIDWMTTAEISDAVPPAFSRFVAEQWLQSRPPQPRELKEK
jgi:DNA (cytosine-5)-methyltransferase 1